jgi:hypothetical protein
MGASVRAKAATKGSPSVSVLGITKAATIRIQPRTRRPKCLASSPCQQPGGVHDASQAHRAADRPAEHVRVVPKLQAEHRDPDGAHSCVQHAGGQPHPLLARLTQPEDPRSTSTAERLGDHPGQEGVRKQQHWPLLYIGSAQPLVPVQGGTDIGSVVHVLSTEPWATPGISRAPPRRHSKRLGQ